jgi:crotonobetainyl-CoA:carnitine CoA-transferase CaiB-like acyl-CoA transferase
LQPSTRISKGALEGVRVIDAATLAAGPWAATTLGEYGAEVIKIEQPTVGDPLRKWGMQKNETGIMWKSVSRNKKTITLDFRRKEGQDILRRLVGVSDVLIMNTRPSTLVRWGLDYESLRRDAPHVVMLHVTGFGAGGPNSDRPGFGTLGEAMSGFSDLMALEDGTPRLPPFMLADGVASMAATIAVMIALYHRDARGGRGQLVDVNLIEPLARLMEHTVLNFDQFGVQSGRQGNRWDVSVPRNTYRTCDGKWIAISGSAPSIALRVFRAIGRPDLEQHPDFNEAQKRLANAEAIDELVQAWVETKTQREALRILEEFEVAVAPVYGVAELLADPHLQARGAYLTLEDPDVGKMIVQAPVARLSETPGTVKYLGRDLGADNQEVFAGLLEMSSDEIDHLMEIGII